MEKYEEIKQVGRGAFGTVVLCSRLIDKKQVIIKKIPVNELPQNERQAALGEVKVLSMLSHPFIIGYIENFIDGNDLCIVMDYAQGGTLADFIHDRKNAFFEEHEILALFAQILLSLHHLHTRQILHRDLKSQNILLNKQRNVCKLSDFGISKILMSKSKASSIIGTPSYLSPEICEGKPYSYKSDIWALGCVLYELATFRKAFDASSVPAIVLKIIRGSLTPVPEGRYSDDFRELVASLLHLDPDRRPSTAEIAVHPLVLGPFCDLFTDMGAIHGRRPLAGMSKLQTQSSSSKPSTLDVPCSSKSLPTYWYKVFTFDKGGKKFLNLPLPADHVQIKQVCVGANQKAALTADGHVITWEDVDDFLLDGACESTPIPRFLKTQSTIMCVACGDFFIACVSDRGILMTVGCGSSGALGHGNFNDVSTLKIVDTFVHSSVISVTCGSGHMLALTSANEVFSWGKGDFGRLGLGRVETYNSPQRVQLPDECSILGLFASIDGSALMCADGTLFVAGNNANNKLGLYSDGASYILSFVPAEKLPKIDIHRAKPVSLSLSHGAIISNGEIVAFGSNAFGQLGPRRSQADGEPKATSKPSKVDINDKNGQKLQFEHVACGDTFTIAVTADNRSVWMWGKGAQGETLEPRLIDFSIMLFESNRDAQNKQTLDSQSQREIKSIDSLNGTTVVATKVLR